MKNPIENNFIKKRLFRSVFSLSGSKTDAFTPMVMLFIIVASITLAEIIVHELLSYFPRLSALQFTLIDHAIIVCIVFPFLYYFSYHPLVRHIRLRQQAEDSLKQAHQQLEQRVQDRTRQLIETNETLMEEIETRERVEHELRQSNRQLSALNAISSKISHSLRIEEIYGTLKDLMARTLNVPTGAIFTRENANVPFSLDIAWGISDELAEQFGQEVFNKAEWQAKTDTQQPFFIHPGNEALPETRWNWSDGFCIPFLSNGESAGMFVLFSDSPNGFAAEDTQLFQSLSIQLGIAFQNARLFQEVQTSRMELQALSRRLVEVQENERRLIAREIHDEISQALTYLIFALDRLRRDACSPEQVVTNVEELEKHIQSIMDNLHRLAVDLRPASLDLLGLVPALRQMADLISEKYALDVHFQAKGFTKRLSPAAESTLFRIIQEASENAVQHARATEIEIMLDNCNGHIFAEVADNGIGFDPAQIDQNHKIGIVAMRERARMLGGNVFIVSKVGKGTRVLVEVPGGD